MEQCISYKIRVVLHELIEGQNSVLGSFSAPAAYLVIAWMAFSFLPLEM